jgi:hypothetical protein
VPRNFSREKSDGYFAAFALIFFKSITRRKSVASKRCDHLWCWCQLASEKPTPSKGVSGLFGSVRHANHKSFAGRNRLEVIGDYARAK